MSRKEAVEAGVRGEQDPGKSSVGVDILRGPLPHEKRDRGERETRKSHGVHIVTTQAQVHASSHDGNMDSNSQVPMSSGIHAMTTRPKMHTSADAVDDHVSPTRRQEIYT